MRIGDYTEIISAEDLEKFLEKTVTFHDSMMKEMQAINRGYVMQDKSMNMDHRLDVRVLFQAQWNPSSFELLCINVSHLNITGPEEFMESAGKIIESPDRLIELSLDGELVIQCKRLFFKLTPDFIGNNEHFGSQIPSSSMVVAQSLVGEWRQCGNCGNAWELSSTRKIATCPSCNSVTYIE
ncbi:hypothetical protein [Microbulbifer sp. TYP-18]|uniref:hypothetical protein n=1 Tax=Microbulbifer sp. TYP-18 TaxID=3230024 RepID=UPI0034C6CDB3